MRAFDAKSVTILVLLVVIAGMVLYMAGSMNDFASTNTQRQVQAIEQAITTAMLQCYALEGSYPPNLEYLQDHYGVLLDHEKYYYLYEVFAKNVRPSITVTSKAF